MWRSNIGMGIALGLAGALTLPTPGAAQLASDRSLSVMVGGLSYDYEGDQAAPMVALRLDQRVSRILLVEVGLSYARATVDIVDHAPPDPVSREGIGNIGAATVGVQAEWPLGHVRPYVGIATGLFVRVEQGQKGANKFVRTTTAVPLGARIPLTQRVLARAETRLRLDEHTGGDSSVNAELTLGFGWKF